MRRSTLFAAWRVRRRLKELTLPHTPPPSTMAAVTFNPLLLSAKASVRGAAVKRTAAKQSKRAAFTVKASDDDMDFMVRISLFLS